MYLKLLFVLVLLAACGSVLSKKHCHHHHHRPKPDNCPGALNGTQGARVVCYYGSWAYGSTYPGTFNVSDIDPNICTHIIYAFIGISAQGDIELLDPNFDIRDGGIKKFIALKRKNRNLKLMAGIGGFTQGGANFSTVAADVTLRARFVSNAVTFLLTRGFEGLDVDWEYPGSNGGNATIDKQDFVLLLRDLRAAFDEYGYLLSAAVAPTQTSIDLSYNITALNDYVDMINIILYDFHGTWDGVTGVNAPLYRQPTDGPEDVLNIDVTIKTWIADGVDISKVNMGLAAYGHAFNLSNPLSNSTGASITGAAQPGPYRGATATWSYNEICASQVNNTNTWTVINHQNSYVIAINNTQWIGYDDRRTIYEKAKYGSKMGLGGIFYWSVDQDDFRGYCGEKYGLIKSGIRGYVGLDYV